MIKNTKTNPLSKLASDESLIIERSVIVEVIRENIIMEKVGAMNNINQEWELYSVLGAYKQAGTLLENAMEARKLKRQATWYVIYENESYKKSFSLSLLKC